MHKLWHRLKLWAYAYSYRKGWRKVEPTRRYPEQAKPLNNMMIGL